MAEEFLFLGDSLIEFFNWQQRFPDRLVYNLGIAGETAEGLLSRLPHVIARCKSPSLVMIMTGTNNIVMEDYGFLATYGTIIDLLQKQYAKTTIVMSSLLPFSLSYLGEAVSRVNKRLKSIACEKNIYYLDLHPLFLDEYEKPVTPFFEADGVHLSKNGYEIWAAALEQTILPVLG
jgi:lysophospholipase L1-like esterase